MTDSSIFTTRPASSSPKVWRKTIAFTLQNYKTLQCWQYFLFHCKIFNFWHIARVKIFFGQASSSTEAGHWHDAGHFFTVLYSVSRTVESHSYYLQQPKKSILLFCHTSFSLAFPNHSCHLKEGLRSTIEHLSKDRDSTESISILDFLGIFLKPLKNQPDADEYLEFFILRFQDTAIASMYW